MNAELAALVQQTRAGSPEAFRQLVDQLQRQPALLIDLAGEQHETVQRAVVDAARNLTTPEVRSALEAIAGSGLPAARQYLAYALADLPGWPLDDLAVKLLHDADAPVRQAAIWAAQCRPGLHKELIQLLPDEPALAVRVDLVNALAESTHTDALPVLVRQLTVEPDHNAQFAYASAANRQLARVRTWPGHAAKPEAPLLAEARRRLQGLGAANYPVLDRWLAEELASFVDVEQLAGFGTVLTREGEIDNLTHAHGFDRLVASVLRVLHGDAPRAAVLIGESGTGKTALVHEIARRLRHDPAGPWHVLRMSPPEWLADTKYTGEWETRVRNVVQACRQPRRVLLYIPNLEELVWMGAWGKSDANVASALAPYIERGDVTILGESTAEGYRKGLGARGPLRRLFTVIEVPEATPQETRAILQAVAEESGANLAEPVLERLIELADYYSTGTAQPGRTVGLLRRVLTAVGDRAEPVGDRDILQTISASTGVPVSFLDDNVALEHAELRRFFEARVMGQAEAVDAVIDLVTLVKAGLTDPNKPFGVLLFVGPTGVGKTELARALAEMLFGDPARMVRLDMSEFATYEAFERLIGQGYRAADPGLLTAAVREKPFAVLLLDEIEKAHPNIYNLCLQIFDAGRLTDTQGRTADFRRTIIVLTSNVGAGATSTGAVGFGQRTGPSAPDRETTLRELSRWFRPEFLNRIDRIVTFRPLSEETAEKIARREVGRVLERSGIARRRLAVDVAPEVLPLLLRDGYSPVFGARPLKRTVERMVLQPLARLIAAGQVPAGSLLRLVASGSRIDIEVSPPESGDSVDLVLPARAFPVADRAATLLDKIRAVHPQAATWRERKSELLALSTQPGFWDEQAASRKVLDEIHRVDVMLGQFDCLEERIHSEAERARRHRNSDRDLRGIEESLDALDGEVRHVTFLLECREPAQLCDALVTLRLVATHGGALDSVQLLAKMYRGLAGRRGLEAEVLDDRQSRDPQEDTITLALGGPGAYALLAGETGLHQVARGRKEMQGGKRRAAEREVVHVEVLPAPLGELSPDAGELRVEVQPLDGSRGRLLQRRKHEVRLFHGPSMTSVYAWMDGNRAEAVERLRPLLVARLHAATQRTGQASSRPAVVRRYTLGPTTLVRDLRSGRTTGRLDLVLEGQLDAFL